VELEPLALIARLAALVPPPRRHTVRYFGVLASHNASRSQVVPAPASLPLSPTGPAKPASKSRYIPWAELLRRTFAIEVKCAKCGGPLRLIALIKKRETIERILVAMHLVPSGPRAYPPCPCPTRLRRARRPPTCPSFIPRARHRGASGRGGMRKSGSTERGDVGEGVLG
jgi:hypothetical protein